jgi:hypothetical protein
VINAIFIILVQLEREGSRQNVIRFNKSAIMI